MQIRTLFHLWRWKMEGGNTFSNFFHLLPTRDKIIFVHVFLRSENPSLGIRDTLKRWSSLLNTRLCIPRVSGSSPPQFHQHNNVHHCNFYMFQVLTGEWGNFLIKFQPSAQTERCWAAADSCFDSRKQTWKISCQLWVDLRAKRKESAYDAKS